MDFTDSASKKAKSPPSFNPSGSLRDPYSPGLSNNNLTPELFTTEKVSEGYLATSFSNKCDVSGIDWSDSWSLGDG